MDDTIVMMHIFTEKKEDKMLFSGRAHSQYEVAFAMADVEGPELHANIISSVGNV